MSKPSEDPRFEGIAPEVMAEAEKANCARCHEQIVASRSIIGTVFLNLYVPALGARERLFLCGLCGLHIRQELHPELQTDPMFQAVKAELLEHYL